ncbi:MAG: hypothetical protein V1738_06670 [Patescibacteria group bacterium]
MSIAAVIMVTLIAGAFSAWLMIRLYSPTTSLDDRYKELFELYLRVQRDAEALNAANLEESQHLRKAIDLMDTVIPEINAWGRRYRRDIADGKVEQDELLLEQFEMLLSQVQKTRTALINELNSLKNQS